MKKLFEKKQENLIKFDLKHICLKKTPDTCLNMFLWNLANQNSCCPIWPNLRGNKETRCLKVDLQSVRRIFIVTQAIHLHIAFTGPFITQSWSSVHAHVLANDLSTIQSGAVVFYAALDFI